MKSVIFDTDIGIDDAVALLFAYYAADISMRAGISRRIGANINQIRKRLSLTYTRQQWA